MDATDATNATDATDRLIRDTEQITARNYEPLPVVLATGEGAWVTDIEGRRYLDMLAAYGAVNQGHRHPRIVAALVEQAGRLTITSRAFHNDRMGPFLARLCEVARMPRALPMNTGAEAVETAIKAMRRWGYQVKGIPPDEAEIIVCERNFHGRTTTLAGISSDRGAREGFGPPTPGFVQIPFDDLEALEDAITERTCGFLVEPVQGEAGVIIPAPDYLQRVRAVTAERRVLLACDEVQTGFGRVGAMFAVHEAGVRPDVLIVGKALGGGVYPVSAMLATDEVMDVFTPGSHGSTFGGNPLAAAVGTAALDVLVVEDLPGRARKLGSTFREALLPLLDAPHVKTLRGVGLMTAIEFHEPRAREAALALMARGILAKETHGVTLRLMPPLVIDEDDLERAAETIVETLSALE